MLHSGGHAGVHGTLPRSAFRELLLELCCGNGQRCGTFVWVEEEAGGQWYEISLSPSILGR